MALKTGLLPKLQRPFIEHIVSQIKLGRREFHAGLGSVPEPFCECLGVSTLPADWYTGFHIGLIGFGVDEKLKGTQ